MIRDFIPPNHTVIGTCSICGGSVITPAVWMGVNPPPQTCSRCGAHASNDHGLPVIPMTPASERVDSSSTSSDVKSYTMTNSSTNRLRKVL